MNWDAIGATAELIGALAVLASLVYLAIQIRHNSSSVDASTEDGVVSGFNEINLMIGSDANLARIYTSGLARPGELAYLVATPGGSEWKKGNPNFLYLWEAVKNVPVDGSIDMTLNRRDTMNE